MPAAQPTSTLLAPWIGPHGGVPPFDKVRLEEIAPAMDAGMAEYLREMDAITAQPAPPTFDNTILAIERAGQSLNRAATIFYVWGGGMSSPEFRKIEAVMAPKVSQFRDQVVQNSKLFARIKAVYEAREKSGLTPEQQRLVWVTYQHAAQKGASLDEAHKAKLRQLNQQLASLYTKFSQNQLGDEEQDALILDRKEDLAGLPQAQIDAAAAEAERRKLPGKWVIANTRSSMEPFLTSSSVRALREKGFRIWTGRGDNGNARDNNAIATEILQLRAQKARLLGYETFAHWNMADSMAKDPQAALALMMSVWKAAVAQFKKDVVEAQALAKKDDPKLVLEAWDYRYYAEKLRKAKYDLDFDQVKPYLQLEQLRKAMFWSAEKLYGLSFVPTSGLPVYHPDMTVYEVKNASGAHVGYWYFDPYARPGKHSGAWMNAYREQHRVLGDVTTIVSNNSNFIKGKPGEPVTVSWDDARTMFHEFGHALHGLLSNVTYPTLSGTNTTRDFVEFPSQFNENYLQTPEVLAFLVNDKGEKIPAALLQKIERAQKFNQGFATAEAQASAIVDMKLHLSAGDKPLDMKAFEKQTLAEIGMPRELVMRHRIPAFGHIFSGDGYAAGYYSYIWAEVLDFDAFEAFKEAGSPWDAATAKRLRDTVLSVGNTVDPMVAFKTFRGREPKPDALFRAKGF